LEAELILIQLDLENLKISFKFTYLSLCLTYTNVESLTCNDAGRYSSTSAGARHVVLSGEESGNNNDYKPAQKSIWEKK
jgi:hypothetical protein